MSALESRLAALERARQASREAQRVRAAIRSAGPRDGALQAADIIAAGESRMRPEPLLRAVPRVGSGTLQRMLGMARVDRGGQRVSEISPRRREELVRQLLRHANRPWGPGA